MPRYLDITPTWAALMPALLAVIEHGTAKGAAFARAELHRLASLADQANADATKVAETRDRLRTHFEAFLWTKDALDQPITMLVIEGAAQDVAAYAMAGHHPAEIDLLAIGCKLTEATARAYGAGWPPSLTYRQ